MKAKVYFLKMNDLAKVKSLLPTFEGRLGLKCHFGEEGNDAFVSASFIKQIAAMVSFPPLLETTVLYRSQRSRASSHRALALRHGFDFARVDILDGEEGDDVMEYELKNPNSEVKAKKYYLGKNLENYNSLLVVSHFKGHIAAGFGGAIKNLAMGLASRRGKLDMHAGTKHHVTQAECVSCGTCIENCPVDAIAYDESGKAFINQNMCISCSKCIAVCPVSAIHIPWGTNDVNNFKSALAEYALAATEGRKCFYINFLVNIVAQCDCMAMKQERMTPDLGILISSDPVAIDQASFDLVSAQCPDFKKYDGGQALIHGEKIGLGSRDYEIVTL